METRTNLSRKLFIRLLGGLGTGLFAWLWYRLSDDQNQKEDRSEFRHRSDISLGVSYFGKYYLFRDKDGVHAFSTTCTHAGCRIGRSNSGILHCGCHGSQFDAASGKPVKGPAILPLQQLECKFEKETGQWVVKLLPPGDSPDKSKIKGS
jgi:Rieske Fe-S protein